MEQTQKRFLIYYPIALVIFLSILFGVPYVIESASVLRVSQGGTGISSTSANQLLATGDSSRASFTATNTPTFANFHATSTTATSTIAGGLQIFAGGSFQHTDLASCDTIDTDASGFLRCGTDATGAAAPNIIYTDNLSTTYYAASSTAGDNLEWLFQNGFVAQSSSTVASTLNVTGAVTLDTALTVANGGTGASSFTQYLILYADTTTSLSQIAIGTSGQVLTSAGAGAVAAFETLSIAAGEYAAASIDGDDINSNVAGRSITLTSASPDTLDADTELYTRITTFAIASSTMSTTTDVTQHKWASAITISRVSCTTNVGAGTSTINFFERTELQPTVAGTQVLTSDLACGPDHTAATTGFANAGIAADAPLSFEIADAENSIISPAITPVQIRVHIDYTYDD